MRKTNSTIFFPQTLKPTPCKDRTYSFRIATPHGSYPVQITAPAGYDWGTAVVMADDVQDPPCPGCGHSKSGHSIKGCMEWDPSTGWHCPCKRTYMEI